VLQPSSNRNAILPAISFNLYTHGILGCITCSGVQQLHGAMEFISPRADNAYTWRELDLTGCSTNTTRTTRKYSPVPGSPGGGRRGTCRAAPPELVKHERRRRGASCSCREARGPVGRFRVQGQIRSTHTHTHTNTRARARSTPHTVHVARRRRRRSVIGRQDGARAMLPPAPALCIVHCLLSAFWTVYGGRGAASSQLRDQRSEEQRRRPQMPPCSPPDPLMALCQGPGQEVIGDLRSRRGEVPNFLGFYLRRRRLAQQSCQQTRRWRSSFCRMISKKRSRRARI
jgi:hypothetical protein